MVLRKVPSTGIPTFEIIRFFPSKQRLGVCSLLFSLLGTIWHSHAETHYRYSSTKPNIPNNLPSQNQKSIIIRHTVV